MANTRNEVSVIETAPFLGEDTDVVVVSYDLCTLRIIVRLSKGGHELEVRFDDVIGFRALDESDLTDMPEPVTLSKGWIYEVHKGGWFDLEATRDAFFSRHIRFYTEYLIIGVDLCVNVIAKSEPRITQIK